MRTWGRRAEKNRKRGGGERMVWTGLSRKMEKDNKEGKDGRCEGSERVNVHRVEVK